MLIDHSSYRVMADTYEMILGSVKSEIYRGKQEIPLFSYNTAQIYLEYTELSQSSSQMAENMK